MTQCFVCRDFKNTIIIRDYAVKEKGFCILHMLIIHTGLRKWSKINIFDIHLKKTNPFGMHEPCIKIVNNQLIFEQYIMSLNQYKYYIEVRNYDEIKRKRLLFDFMQRTVNRLNGLYLNEIFI